MTKKEFKKLVNDYGKAAVALSWAGGGHPDHKFEIERKCENALLRLIEAYGKMKGEQENESS